jgi:hypothetical protein
MSLVKGKMYAVNHSLSVWIKGADGTLALGADGRTLPAGTYVVVLDIEDRSWGLRLELLAHNGTIVGTNIFHENSEYWFKKAKHDI